ncbi:MAG: hypothetical protein ABMA64_30295 [Myxococcota bacterium]
MASLRVVDAGLLGTGEDFSGAVAGQVRDVQVVAELEVPRRIDGDQPINLAERVRRGVVPIAVVVELVARDVGCPWVDRRISVVAVFSLGGSISIPVAICAARTRHEGQKGEGHRTPLIRGGVVSSRA